MKKGELNKVIYFDRETIRNILQEFNKGESSTKTDVSTSMKSEATINIGAKINLSVPFFDRLGFLISGNLAAAYIAQKDTSTTLTSTDISEFQKIKAKLTERLDITISDIENSSTFFRVAAGYLRIMKGGVEDIDVREFKSALDSFDGYDTYKISENEYIRFNTTAFVSNYKRNDLLTTKMNLFCVFVGEFSREDFDFQIQISKMETLVTNANKVRTLHEANIGNSAQASNVEADAMATKAKGIKLYDVVYASVPIGDNHEK